MRGAARRTARIELPPTPENVARARKLVSIILEAWELDDPEQVAVLLTSEVITNAVRHTSTDILLELAVSGDDILTVGAWDNHPELPIVIDSPSEGEGGRGMRLVASLAARWGTSGTEPGRKMVWFELPVSSGARSAGPGASEPSESAN